jgi:hypothetical protein
VASGDDLDRETEDLLSMLGPEPEEPSSAPGGPKQERGLTALLDDLDDGGAPGKRARTGSTERRTTPLQPPPKKPEAAAQAWPLETQSDAEPPAMDPRPTRPKTDSSLYPRVESEPLEPVKQTFDEPLDPDIPRPRSPVFEPGFTPVSDKPEPPPELSSLLEPTPPPEPLTREPAPAVHDDPESAAAAADALAGSDPLAELRAAQTRKPRTLLWVGIISFVAAGLGAVIYTQADAFHPERDQTRAMVAADEKERALAEHRRKQPVEGTLLIDASEAEVAVWLKLGRTPLESVAVKSSQVHEVRYELEGYKTLDEVVARPHWIGEGGQQRARQSVQLQPGPAGAPAFPPQSAVRPAPGPEGKGPMILGSEPAGAEVWLLIGFTPNVKFSGARVGRSYEIKLLKEGFRPSFASVTADDWMLGEREVKIDVKLSALVAGKRPR